MTAIVRDEDCFAKALAISDQRGEPIQVVARVVFLDDRWTVRHEYVRRGSIEAAQAFEDDKMRFSGKVLGQASGGEFERVAMEQHDYAIDD